MAERREIWSWHLPAFWKVGIHWRLRPRFSLFTPPFEICISEGTFGWKVFLRPSYWKWAYRHGIRPPEPDTEWPDLRTLDIWIGPFHYHWIETPWPS